jgi:hypothetical protein
LFCSLAKILSSAFLSFLSQHFCVADRKSLSPKTVGQPMEQNAKEKKNGFKLTISGAWINRQHQTGEQEEAEVGGKD